MRSIKRTVSLTTCVGRHLDSVTGEFEDFFEVLEGLYSRDAAQAHLRRTCHDDTIVVASVEQGSHVYVLSGEDFLRYAVEQ